MLKLRLSTDDGGVCCESWNFSTDDAWLVSKAGDFRQTVEGFS